ncbi:DNA/RNA helicase domain-containing protein [Streptomyces sp. MBT65]|uniref:DNA/RNA helicase domain-containing protein n=1 Tax=Streptomyces sp. MBT65 TaxID=1488395 RepID=UPI0027DA812F|nr:DNA/RNA helicase domain-containing protein [Streptomyces sp. MBT65]
MFGPDLVWRNGAWIVDRAASKDPVFRKVTSDAEVRRLILNTYKVLLTRGMIGTVIYSTDAETRAKLRELIETPAAKAS